VIARALATIALAAACGAVWWYAPVALEAVGLGDFDIPGRVCLLFLLLSLVELVQGMFQTWNAAGLRHPPK